MRVSKIEENIISTQSADSSKYNEVENDSTEHLRVRAFLFFNVSIEQTSTRNFFHTSEIIHIKTSKTQGAQFILLFVQYNVVDRSRTDVSTNFRISTTFGIHLTDRIINDLNIFEFIQTELDMDVDDYRHEVSAPAYELM